MATSTRENTGTTTPEGNEAIDWGHPGVLLFLFLAALGMLAGPIWAATCVVLFQEKLGDVAIDYAEEVERNREAQIEREEQRREEVRDLRQLRMPPP